MDKGLVLVLGVLLGSLGTTLLFQLLLLTDDDARSYFSALFGRLGAGSAATSPETQPVNSKENVSQRTSIDTTEEQPGGVGNRPAGQFYRGYKHGR